MGFLGGYAGEEGFNSGTGFYLWNLATEIPPFAEMNVVVYLASALAALAALAAAIVFRRDRPDRAVAGAALLAAAFMVLLSPHYPWYFAWLVVFACLVPAVSLLWLTTAGFLLYLVPVGSHIVADSHRVAVETILYAPFTALALLDLYCRGTRLRGGVGR